MKKKTPTTLAKYIFEDMVSRLASQEDFDTKLTLAAIAEHYEVSISPVRTAIEELVSNGYLLVGSNGRIVITAKGKKTKRGRRPNVSAPVDHTQAIRADLIELSLQGHDGFLREPWAAERYGIGRTALRPIFSQLAGQGLLEQIPRRGWRVRPFNADDLRSFIEVRELLELHALELARPHFETERLEALLEANQGRSPSRKTALNNQLHDYWIQLAGNHYIQRFFERDAVYYRALFDYATPEAHLAKKMAAQHCDILTALLAKKWSTAQKALRKHIHAQEPIVKSLVAKL